MALRKSIKLLVGALIVFTIILISLGVLLPRYIQAKNVNEQIQKLGDKNSSVRLKAEAELSGIGKPAIEPLIRAREQSVRQVALQAAAQLGC